MIAPLLFAVSAAELLIDTSSVLASCVLQPRICNRLLGCIEGYYPEAPGAFAATNVACFGHKPHHLEVHSAEQAAASPSLEEAEGLLRFLAVLTVEHREAFPTHLAPYQLVDQHQCVFFFLDERVAQGTVSL